MVISNFFIIQHFRSISLYASRNTELNNTHVPNSKLIALYDILLEKIYLRTRTHLFIEESIIVFLIDEICYFTLSK